MQLLCSSPSCCKSEQLPARQPEEKAQADEQHSSQQYCVQQQQQQQQQQQSELQQEQPQAQEAAPQAAPAEAMHLEIPLIASKEPSPPSLLERWSAKERLKLRNAVKVHGITDAAGMAGQLQECGRTNAQLAGHNDGLPL
ncbi:hypothetical protein OEZ86_009394 [Tetradesmus obliquus]|nr:hypothetical protein OEZ86_009394 [Tetradesmus obliquus]